MRTAILLILLLAACAPRIATHCPTSGFGNMAFGAPSCLEASR